MEIPLFSDVLQAYDLIHPFIHQTPVSDQPKYQPDCWNRDLLQM